MDIVPAGPGLLAAGSLTWPESGYRMNLLGLRLAFDHHVRIAIDDRHYVEVATSSRPLRLRSCLHQMVADGVGVVLSNRGDCPCAVDNHLSWIQMTAGMAS